ncbi:MAG: hypothetical protein JO301_16535 [Chitinophagaceae bacterium]|nr:hypothetical protein [Chitinophagaceae bacterium]
MIRQWLQSFPHLFYPHVCEGCGTDTLYEHQFLCSRCVHRLPETKFFAAAGNPVEKLFYGRCDVTAAGAAFYFTKHSLLQHLLMQLKYRGNREAGYFLGRMMGRVLAASGRFDAVDLLVPLPLNPRREFERGYNQASLLCRGISETWHKPVLGGRPSSGSGSPIPKPGRTG